MYKRDTGLFTRNSSFFMIRRCSRYTSRTVSGTAPAPKLASASPVPRGGPAAPSNLAFPTPSVKGLVLHPAKARETR